MDWRDLCKHKLTTAEEAVKLVRSGDTVSVATYASTPLTLCDALFERGRAGELTGVRVDHPAPLYNWADPAANGAFDLRACYLTPQIREACNSGAVGYIPVGIWKSYEVPAGFELEPDVFMVPVSPPDAKGYCSFGSGVWMSGPLSRNAKKIICEVREDFIRTYGENYIHLDQIDVMVEATPPAAGQAAPAALNSEEEVAATEVICSLVASELVNDGDTIQIGVGTVSSAMGLFLAGKRDLGIHTEVLTGGIVDLVKQGVVTGRYKKLHPYKVVATGVAALPQEELNEIHENPVFELYDFGYTDDLRIVSQLENFVAINNALLVDLTGQVTAESLDHRTYSGVGGQSVFMIAASYSNGGKSVSVLPSSSVPSSTGQRVSRIVPVLPTGCSVTVPRTFVDYVVTEYGIAELRGKSIQERARALVAIAHPEMRPELERKAAELYHA
ncbi:acetyl-CoA hydrolase/transferase C-terminal domain-containing protein [Pseudohaliea sp.]|uniref:acetyl-CoA hydrolase/transferase family protein n=1 Tax=Pseudohaliea sp. TaxID=2740289 RepID=UPI0032EAC72A